MSECGEEKVLVYKRTWFFHGKSLLKFLPAHITKQIQPENDFVRELRNP